MKNKRICCFAGHSDVCGEVIKDEIEKRVKKLIVEYGVNEFWVGNYGNFDICAGMVIQKLKDIYPDIKLNLVIPYITQKINRYSEMYYEKYDNILMADISCNVPKRIGIIKTNEYMVDNADFLICYIERMWGGAAKTFEYAKKRKICILNIAKKT